MEITQERQDEVVTLVLKGRLDAATSSQFEASLIGCIDKGDKRFIIDFAALDYISSSGLRVLLMGAKRLRESKGKIVIASPQPHVKDVFDIAGFSSIFPIFSTRADAAKSV